MKVLVVGATGYVGGRLTSRLVKKGYSVRVMVRDVHRYLGRPGSDKVEVIEGNVKSYEDCAEAVRGCEVAYYLVHSLGTGKDYGAVDRMGATNFINAGSRLKHVIYLGGLQPDVRKNASMHLRSRAEVGKILNRYQTLTEFRAGPIIGSGSASFEMVRYLTERIPVMITPKWVYNHVQPIAIRDVLSYLVTAAEMEPQGAIDIGMESLSFADMMSLYAKERGLRRRILAIPVLAPSFAARWVSWVTPISKGLAVPLVEGIAYPLIGNNGRARELFPEVSPIAYPEAVRLALEKIRTGDIESRWSGSMLDQQEGREMIDREGIFREVVTRRTEAKAGRIFRTLLQVGGENGWLTWSWAWRVRGWIDKFMGGPGLRRGRRDPDELWPGEVVDFWRVERVEADRLLRLKAEMKLPGEAWLEWEIIDKGEQRLLIQRASFIPHGLWGFLYWYSVYPFHIFIFPGLVREILRRAS